MAVKKYLLSTGEYTDKPEKYIIDLFRLYLTVYPKDIPGAGYIGFNFVLTDVKKDGLATEVESRVSQLVNRISEKIKEETSFLGKTYTITTKEIALIDETRVRIVIDVNENTSELIIDL